MEYPQLCQFGSDLTVSGEEIPENFHRWDFTGTSPPMMIGISPRLTFDSIYCGNPVLSKERPRENGNERFFRRRKKPDVKTFSRKIRQVARKSEEKDGISFEKRTLRAIFTHLYKKQRIVQPNLFKEIRKWPFPKEKCPK